MFIEPPLGKKEGEGRAGWIEVVCGCMFSGKTEELIRRLNRALIARQRVEIFKPSIDKRYHVEKIVSHAEREIRSTPVNFASDILLLAGDCDVVGIDEAQFFDDAIVEVCNQLANSGKRVIVAGLDMDYEGKPFGPMPNLLAVADIFMYSIFEFPSSLKLAITGRPEYFNDALLSRLSSSMTLVYPRIITDSPFADKHLTVSHARLLKSRVQFPTILLITKFLHTPVKDTVPTPSRLISTVCFLQ